MPKLSQYARERVELTGNYPIVTPIPELRSWAKYIAWWLIKETNYNEPWHFKKNAKQINVYSQIIELTVHFDNVYFVTATVLRQIYSLIFDSPLDMIRLILLVFGNAAGAFIFAKKTNIRFETRFASL